MNRYIQRSAHAVCGACGGHVRSRGAALLLAHVAAALIGVGGLFASRPPPPPFVYVQVAAALVAAALSFIVVRNRSVVDRRHEV